ncbi:MAG: hypothetical protein IAI49_14390, partial [Candidatus Eremiobacteraeota bacterium]|nr:hypothetical protein [Candidatus Eremiobacteraeota bacterium]
ITPSGSFKVLHSFTVNPDGAYPASSLLAFGGALIGTTYGGGPHNHGLLFKLSYDGVLKGLHSFEKTDGTGPAGQLTAVGDVVYGTTEHDGANSGGTLYGFKL